MMITLLSQSLKGKLNLLTQVFEQFPASLDRATMAYDHVKLIYILRDKELKQLCGNADVVEEATKVSVNFGNLLNVVNLDPQQAIAQYRALECAFQDFEGFMYLYVKQWAISIKALYYYRTGALNLAQGLTLECIALNDTLIHEGMSTLVLRSCELNRNSGRLLIAKNSFERGAKLVGGVLDYLLNGSTGCLYGSIFKNIHYWNQNVYVREGYAYETFRGLVHNLIVLNKPSVDRKTLFSYYFENLTFDVFSPDRQIIEEWLEVKKVFYYGDKYEFIDLFVSYMQKQTVKLYDILKISLIQDVEELFFEYDLANPMGFKFQVNRYLNFSRGENEYVKGFIKCYDQIN